MATCDQCGNDYANPMRIEKDGASYTFDSFECAMTKLAPTCPECDARILGHGVDAQGHTYCCNHCADRAGARG